uniref:Uncharacterized protein n=1 Tax=Geospiza parvula TaxID=87175 RepID=A0A8C3NSK4_GEOPR
FHSVKVAGVSLLLACLCVSQPGCRSLLQEWGSLAPTDSCRLSRDPGPCSGMLSRFFYNSSSMACETFHYGGCLGNGNNFYSEKECLQYCGAPQLAGTPLGPHPRYINATMVRGGTQSAGQPITCCVSPLAEDEEFLRLSN